MQTVEFLIELTQAMRFISSVGHFFARPGEKMTHKWRKVPGCPGEKDACVSSNEITYHAATGQSHLLGLSQVQNPCQRKLYYNRDLFTLIT